MSKDLVQFTSDAGAPVELTAQDIKRYVCENATDKEVGLFLAHCAAHKLDPIGSKDAYLVKYGNAPASIITGYQVFNRRARNFPDYAGIKSGVVTLKPNGQVQHKQGSAVYPDIDGKLLGGWAEVYVKGWEAPAYVEVSMSDYSTGKSNWSKMPGVMIEKVAKASAWRLAYPSEFSGMYTAEEMAQAQPRQTAQDAKHGPIHVEPVSVEPVSVEPAGNNAPQTAAQDRLQPIRDLIKPFANKLGYDMANATGAVLDYVGAGSMTELDERQVADACTYMQDIIDTEAMEA